MKKLSFSRFALSLTALISLVALVTVTEARDDFGTSVEVALEKSECGSSCVMVFARVGERFRYELKAEDSYSAIRFASGENASGEKSTLPAGLSLDKKENALVGVPLKAGFHEFVVLRTDKGVTREEVVLIDIQGHPFSSGSSDYASYFAGGLR
ncbi:hypothetical protein VDG1235_1431 [Verrucomicrobiia bacterium DG1235]|nr:hypothetical protein VDG1235_1431 [Verrucomicrobiae bacterium DG1235]